MSIMPPVPQPPMSRFAQYMLEPGRPLPGVYIPAPKAERSIQAFLMQHQLPEESPNTPRCYLFQGPPGVGKTEIMVRSALAMGALMMLPPSVFSSKHEGGGVQTVSEALEDLSADSHAKKRPVAILFDDMDHSSLSIDENTSHTTNPQEVIGFLQHLASNRGLYTTFTGLPIPLLATANAADRMAPSLFRHMRAKVFTHSVDDDTKQELAHKLFQPANADERTAIDRLFKAYRKEAIAFWPALASDYRAASIEKVMEEHGPDAAAVRKAMRTKAPLDVALLTTLAVKCRAAKPCNFLWKWRKAD